MLLLLQPVRAEVDQGEALEMLARMIQAKKTLDYQGTLVITQCQAGRAEAVSQCSWRRRAGAAGSPEFTDARNRQGRRQSGLRLPGQQ